MSNIGDLKIGVTANGTTHSDMSIPDITTKVRMVKDAGIFDYIDRAPPDEEFGDLTKASEAFDMPVLAGGWYYLAGRDEHLFERNIVKARILGSKIHNVQVFTNHADGHLLSNDEVAEYYLNCFDFAMGNGVKPCFEVHVNMWSEHFGRIAHVAALVERRGIPFHLTLDHSHVIFKIGNYEEQHIQDMRAEIEAGTLVIDPTKQGNVIRKWIDANIVHHCHCRAVAPNNPKNVWAQHPDGRVGRGIQYPFQKPKSGEWHSEWNEEDLDLWKYATREILLWRAVQGPNGTLKQISCEFIPFTDYGAGAKYSVFGQNIACAKWLRNEWEQALMAVPLSGRHH